MNLDGYHRLFQACGCNRKAPAQSVRQAGTVPCKVSLLYKCAGVTLRRASMEPLLAKDNLNIAELDSMYCTIRPHPIPYFLDGCRFR